MSLPHVRNLPKGSVRLSHVLMLSVYSLSVHAHRVLALSLSKVIEQLNEQGALGETFDDTHNPDKQLQQTLPPAIFTLSELKKIFGCTYAEVGRKAKEACAELMSTNITHYLSEDWRMCQWATYAERSGKTIRIDIHPLLRQYITSLNKLYTLYTLDDVAHFNTSAQFRLYELFKMNAHKVYISISQAELKQFLSIDEKRYMEKNGRHARKNFKMRVIDPSLAKINEHTDIRVDVQYSDTPNGMGFAFKISEKERNRTGNDDLFSVSPISHGASHSFEKGSTQHLQDNIIDGDCTEALVTPPQQPTLDIHALPDRPIDIEQIACKDEYNLSVLNLSESGERWIRMMIPYVSNANKALIHTRVPDFIARLESWGVSDEAVMKAVVDASAVSKQKKSNITSLLFFENFIKKYHAANQMGLDLDECSGTHGSDSLSSASLTDHHNTVTEHPKKTRVTRKKTSVIDLDEASRDAADLALFNAKRQRQERTRMSNEVTGVVVDLKTEDSARNTHQTTDTKASVNAKHGLSYVSLLDSEDE